MNNNHNPGSRNEQQDPDLAELFRVDEVPTHKSSFWSDLQTDLRTDAAVRKSQPKNATAPDPTTVYQAGPQPINDGEQPPIVSLDQARRNRRAMPLAAAAAVIAVLGGVAIWLGVTNIDSVEVTETAAEQPEPGQLADDDLDVGSSGDVSGSARGLERSDGDSSSGATTDDQNATSDSAADGSSSPSVDYTVGNPQMANLGRGSFSGFSPNNERVLVVDLLGNGQTGCEGAEVLALYSQDLRAGDRVIALRDSFVETGGLDLKILGPVESDGTVKVAGTDFCDGFRNTTWTATMTGEGQLTDVQKLAIDEDVELDVGVAFVDDPFEQGDVISLSDGATVASPDGQFELVRTADSLVIADQDQQRFELPFATDDLYPEIAWSPNDGVVAISTRDSQGRRSTYLWDFQTGKTSQSLTDEWTRDLAFDSSGQLLGMTVVDGAEQSILVVNFGEKKSFSTANAASSPNEDSATPDNPGQPSASKPCSASAAPPGALTSNGVTPAAAETMANIDLAASMCDWDLFEQLVDDNFTASFGGGEAIELWQASEQFWFDGDMGRKSTMQLLRQLLREPSGPLSDRSEDGTAATVWPQVFNSDRGCDSYTDEDIASMGRLDYGPDDIDAGCEFAEGYIGFRTAIADDGQWMFFIAGD